ncbi:MAG: response regulator [Cyclobacteriaceae bacterium]
MKTILLIEDNAEILENLIEYLELEGYSVLFANNGREGVEIAEKLAPDLIICDIYMSEMNGHEVLQLILDSKASEVPFIFSTSNSETVDRDEALALGADDYIIKPFELESLLLMSKKWIKLGSGRHRQSKQ